MYLDYLAGDQAHQPALLAVLTAWENGDVELFTSALTIAEVLYVRCLGTLNQPDPSRYPDIDRLFESPVGQPQVNIVQVSRTTALAARDLVRAHGIRPKDAIHVASALEAHCDVLHTHDSMLIRASGMVGGTPLLRIEPPSWTQQLPLTPFSP